MDQRQLQIVLKLQDEASRELRKLTSEINTSEQATSRWGGALSFVATAAKAAVAAVGAAAVAGATLGIRVAAQLETAQVGLQTLLGDSEKAAKTIDRLKKEAARTPFELPGLAQATQLLTSVTKDGDKSIDIILDIGEGLAAMGKGQSELDRIIVNLQQIAATGRAALIDVRQFAFAGIPIYEMLTEATGKSGEALEELISSGGVTFDLLTEMFDKANDAGGRFFNAYKNNAGTFNQAMSNMKDSIGIFFADVVTQTGLFRGLTDAMIFASNWLANYKANIQSIKETVTGWLDQIDQQTGLITLLSDAVANIVYWFQERLWPAILDLWEALKPLQPFFEAMVVVFGTMLVAAIGGLIIVIQGLIIGFTELLTWAVKVAEYISKYLTWYINSLADAINDVINFVDKLIEKFNKVISLAKDVAKATAGIVGKAVSAVIPGRASGGPVSGGQPYIVGEQGPELFVPGVSGSIVPNGALAGAGSVNVYVYGDVSGNELVDKVRSAIGMDIKRRVRL